MDSVGLEKLNSWLAEVGQMIGSDPVKLDEDNRCYFLLDQKYPTLFQYDAVSKELVLSCYVGQPLVEPSVALLTTVLEWNHHSEVLGGATLGLCRRMRQLTVTFRIKCVALADSSSLYNLIQNFTHVIAETDDELSQLILSLDTIGPNQVSNAQQV